MDADRSHDGEFLPGLGENARALFFGEWRIGFVVEGEDRTAVVVVTHPAFKRHTGPGVRVGQRTLQSGGIERLGRNAKHFENIISELSASFNRLLRAG